MIPAGFKIVTTTRKARWEQDRRFKVVITHMWVGETTPDHPNGDDPRSFSGINAHTDSKMSEWCVYNHGAYSWVATEDEARAALERIVVDRLAGVSK